VRDVASRSRQEDTVADVWVVLTVVGFFAVCVAFVRGCDRIIGPDDASDLDDGGVVEATEGSLTGGGVG
jgi:hypothetical protein